MVYPTRNPNRIPDNRKRTWSFVMATDPFARVPEPSTADDADQGGGSRAGRCAIVRRVTPDRSPAVRPSPRPRRSIAFVIGAGIVFAITLCAVFAPLLTAWIGHGPYEQVAPRTITPPTPPDRDHPLGTDGMGRDQLSRLIHGARVSLVVGVVAEAIALIIGTAVGAVAGYAGGKI